MPRRKLNQYSFIKHQNSEFNLSSDEVKPGDSNNRNMGAFTNKKLEEPAFLNTFDYIVLTTIALATSIHYLTYFDSVSWQLSSIGRILLIKTLPYYDWRPLKNRQCLIDSSPNKLDSVNDYLNCDICENIKHIDVYDTLEEDILEERYLKLDIPVILTKGLGKWPSDSKFVQELRQDEEFALSYPCRLSTNVFKDPDGSVSDILDNVEYFDEFFLHFQNCDSSAMRVLRRYTFRPELLPPMYSPTLYNWLIWNENYNTTFFKRVDLVEKLVIFGQLFGSTYVTLVPRKNCEGVCPYLNVKLSGGDMLIFTSLWDLEYRPCEKGENMAVILETSYY